jgi:hypothetical protein
MLDSKLIKILRTFSSRETEELSSFLFSPFNKISEKEIQLFEHIKHEHPHYNNSQKLDKKLLFSLLYPQKKKFDSSLRALMSQLNKHIEDYLIHKELQKAPLLKEQLLMRALLENRLPEHLDKKLEQETKRQKKQVEQDCNYFYHLLQVADIEFQHTIINDNRSSIKRSHNVMDKLDLYYIASKLRYASALMTRQNIIKEEYNIYLLDEILANTEQGTLLETPYIQFYYHLCLLFKNSDESEIHFHHLKALLTTFPKVLSNNEKRQIYAFMANYCTQQYKSGKEEYLEHVFELYKDMVQEGILIMDDGTISPHQYKNIATAGLKLGEFAWTEQFIKNYKLKIPKDFRALVFNYNMAALDFSLANYDRAKIFLLEMSLINSEDVFYSLNHRILLIKTYYELDEFDPLKSSLEALRGYIRRTAQKLSSYNIKACQNFVNLCHRLLRLRKSNVKSINSLEKDIRTIRPLVDHQWLLKKVLELQENESLND